MHRSTCPLATLVAGLFALIVAPPAHAQIVPLLQDDFESYADQAAFQAAWPVAGTQPSGTWSTDQSVSPTHSILSPAVTTAQGNTLAARNLRTFTATAPTAANPIVYRFNFFDSNGTNASYRQYANLQAGAAPGTFGQLISMGLNNNIIGTSYMARILGYNGGTGASAYSPLDGVSVGTTPPLRSTGFHELRAIISDTQIDLYVDGILAHSAPTAWGTPAIFDRVLMGSGLSNNGNAVYFDDMLVGIQAIPEPTSLALAGLGLAGVWLRKRRRTAA